MEKQSVGQFWGEVERRRLGVEFIWSGGQFGSRAESAEGLCKSVHCVCGCCVVPVLSCTDSPVVL